MKHGPFEGKATVFGLAQRAKSNTRRSRVRAMVVADHSAKALMPKLFANVLPGSVLYTDALRSYHAADRAYVHEFVDHSIKYVEGRVHTNTIENFWSCLKRTLHGTYIAPRAFHLDAYLDEQVFRFNAREDNDAGRFVSVLKNTDGRRVTYKQLTASHPRWRLRPGRAAKSPTHRQ